MPGPPVVDIRNSFGDAFVGLLVSTMLSGVTIAQIWFYVWNYWNRDSKPLKFFVAFITFTDALHTIICAYAVYCMYPVSNFGNVEDLHYDMWALDVRHPEPSYLHSHSRYVRLMQLQAFLSVIIIDNSVQLYYARRVYIVSQSLICPIIIVVTVVIAFFFSICELPALPSSFRSGMNFKLRFLPVFSAKAIALNRFSDYHSSAWMLYVAFGAVTVGDTCVAMSMCWSLYRRRTGFARTDSIIMTLMAYSINSGLLTGLLNIAMIISVMVSPSSLIWVGFSWATTKCYVNSLLAMLNSRDHIRGRQSTTDRQDNAYDISSIRVAPLSEARVSFSMQRTTTLDYGRNKSNHDGEPTFEVPKQVARTIPFQSQAQTSESSA
ncbi:hypothetical protein EDB85DRAFT_2149382 [Lactarius pseudohatsudake]|nr:hypothetical protein EDB85DRAFT_2149382 [Lactarius pseudohatsudake]